MRSRPLRSMTFLASGAIPPCPTAAIFSPFTATKPSMTFPCVTILPFSNRTSTCAMTLPSALSRLFLQALHKSLVHELLDYGIIIEFLGLAAGGLIFRSGIPDRLRIVQGHHKSLFSVVFLG